MPHTVKLYREGQFRVKVLYDEEIPLEITFTYQGLPLTTLTLDAIDWMVFGRIPDLQCLPDSEKLNFLKLLAYVVQNDLGGKFLIQISPTDIELINERVGLATTPIYPKEFPFFNNLMYLRDVPQFKACTKKYSHTDDKSILIPRVNEISRLLIDHAAWAGVDPINRRAYGEAAILDRLANERIIALAALDPSTYKIVGFVRVYQAGAISYLGDLVVHQKERGQGLAHQLMQLASAKLSPNSTLLLIAGDEQLVKMYQKLNFVKLAEAHPLILKDKVLVSGLVPRQTLLLRFLNRLFSKILL